MSAAEAASAQRHAEKLKRQRAYLDEVAKGKSHKDIQADLQIAKATYESWRYHDKKFAAMVDSTRANAQAYQELKPQATSNKSFDFAQERKYFFGHDSPPFHLEMVQAFEQTQAGNIAMFLLPPEHGKTTMFEDYATLKLAHSPTTRMHVASESQSLSKKILKRVRNRLDPAPGNPRLNELRRTYGPFAPPPEDKVLGQPWAATHFDVYQRYVQDGGDDERDYSMAALGFGSQIIGSRSDILYLDDMQSRKTLNLTEKHFDEFQQDWLSRPGARGITVIAGNRVDEGDIYEAIDDAFDSDLLTIVRYPAILPNGEPLWPDRWPLPMLEKERKKHGDDVWERNWMQRPKAVRSQTFNEQMIDQCKNPLLPWYHVNHGEPIYIGVDPGIAPATTAVVGIAIQHGMIRLVSLRQTRNLRNNAEILATVEQEIADLQIRGGIVTDVCFEENAFQKGLVQDPYLEQLERNYGFTARGHLTGMNK